MPVREVIILSSNYFIVILSGGIILIILCYQSLHLTQEGAGAGEETPSNHPVSPKVTAQDPCLTALYFVLTHLR